MFAAGTYGLDSASQIDPNAAHASGSQFQFRYSAGQGNTSPKSQFKLLGVDEIAHITGAGEDFIANSEWYETRCTEGTAAGSADGQADVAYWNAHKLNPGASIYVSWDAAPNSSQYNDVGAYLGAYNSALGGQFHADGLYAGIPALMHFGQLGAIKHGWVPEAASWSAIKQALSALGISAPPAVTTWDLWQPTKSQVAPAMAYLNGLLAGSGLQSVIWQTGNHWFGNAADENIILQAGPLGSHLEAVGASPAPAPVPVPGPVATKPFQGQPVPALIARGTNQYLGSIDGPAASHGGYNAGEQAIVKMLQQRLIVCGFVPGQTNPNSGWADGIFDTRGGGVGNGATSQAVKRFQAAHMPGTTLPGQCWWDDWTKLFNL